MNDEKIGALLPQPCREPGCNAHRCNGTMFCITHLHEHIRKGQEKYDPIDHPKHYTSHPSGIECIQVTEYMGFNIGNAVKYLWRADEKGAPVEDLRKAIWYINREIEKRSK